MKRREFLKTAAIGTTGLSAAATAETDASVITPIPELFTLQLMWSADIAGTGNATITAVDYSECGEYAASGLEFIHGFGSSVSRQKIAADGSVREILGRHNELMVGIHQLLQHDGRSCTFTTTDPTAYSRAVAHVEQCNAHYKQICLAVWDSASFHGDDIDGRWLVLHYSYVRESNIYPEYSRRPYRKKVTL